MKLPTYYDNLPEGQFKEIMKKQYKRDTRAHIIALIIGLLSFIALIFLTYLFAKYSTIK